MCWIWSIEKSDWNHKAAIYELEDAFYLLGGMWWRDIWYLDAACLEVSREQISG